MSNQDNEKKLARPYDVYLKTLDVLQQAGELPATFDKDKAIARYSELSRLIHVGAYQERDHDGNYGEDGIEEAVDKLDFQAAQNGLVFAWHKDTDTYTLEPMSAEDKATFELAMMQQEGDQAE